MEVSLWQTIGADIALGEMTLGESAHSLGKEQPTENQNFTEL
jgi:hypothetical protein